jgi:hypothetical protein
MKKSDIIKSLQQKDERTRDVRAKREAEFNKAFQKFPSLVINSHSGAIWNDIRASWENGCWISTVCMCDMFCENQLRGIIVSTFNETPPESYDDVLLILSCKDVRLIDAKTVKKLKDLKCLRLYYDQPYGSAMAGTPYRKERDKGEFIEDFAPRDAKVALQAFIGMQLNIVNWYGRLRSEGK